MTSRSKPKKKRNRRVYMRKFMRRYRERLRAVAQSKVNVAVAKTD